MKQITIKDIRCNGKDVVIALDNATEEDNRFVANAIRDYFICEDAAYNYFDETILLWNHDGSALSIEEVRETVLEILEEMEERES